MTERIDPSARLYVDANCLIYFFERDDALQHRLAQVFEAAATRGGTLWCSEIGLAECLYGAFRLQSAELEALYLETFDETGLILPVPVDGARLMAAAKLGADTGLKLIDAVHVAAALEAGCEVMVTNDARIRSSHGLRVVQLADLEVTP